MTHLVPFLRTASQAPALVRWTERLETSDALDAPVRALQPLADALLADPTRADALRGMWVGHAIHPVLTDVPIGTWTSATVLDLVGGESARGAACRLIGVGILAALPTALTGVAEWGETGVREKRVGVVHAVGNSMALGLYSASWLARRRGNHRRGKRLALAGAVVLSGGAYLGGHLTEVRKVSSYHPAYDHTPVA
ncbi:DUF2231 domain-containing protein [Nocardioides mesophilus]|uniref:DUF2231 domain-containing protein n=1 Tax=Nocardioides mesophilus TaxID=433659 RepID=A0A7G9RE62_9ACTN|nr:DUF2231 domain-containing protein [Nocardioides mesophilus]QNN53887.1 DUF2231 domain-containing protein [Nocardioides mesophilus]